MLQLEQASISSALQDINALDRKSSSNSRTFEWTSSKTQELIIRYQSLRELWDITCPAYRNRWKKRKAWKILAEYLSTGELEVRRKMHNLRSQFSQEVRKKKSSWHFYSAIEFLKDVSINSPKYYNSFRVGRGMNPPASSNSIYGYPLFKTAVMEENNDSDSSESNFSNDVDQLWPKQKTKELIACYRNYPQLWNRVDPNYRDKQKRKEGVESLARSFNVSTHEVQRKIHNLRSQYCQEQKKSLKNIYESSWYYLPYLKFLDQGLFSQESFLCDENETLNKYPYSENCPDDVYKLLRQLNSEHLLNNDGSLAISKNEVRSHVVGENNGRIVTTRTPGENPSVCFNWTVQATTDLIHRFHSLTELWDTSAPDYRNKAKKQRTFANLARQFGIDEEELHRKLHNLRSQFNQEFKKVHTKPNFQSSWCFYASMLFLKQKNGLSYSNSLLVKREPHHSEGGPPAEFDNPIDEGSTDRTFLNNCLEPIVDVRTVLNSSIAANSMGWFHGPPIPRTNDSAIAAIKAEPMIYNTSSVVVPHIVDPKSQNQFLGYRPNPAEGPEYERRRFENGFENVQQLRGFWTIAKTHQLIAAYESLPQLWNASCVTYRNRLKRRKAWQLLASEFGVNKEEVQRKMHNIRSQFRQELRREAKPSHESSWIFFSSLLFLQHAAHP